MNTEIINFAAYLRKEERSAATIEKYIREAGRFLRWLDGRTAGKELALAYKEALMGERTPAGVNGAVAALNCLFSFWGLPECRMRSVKIQRRIFRDEERELTEYECPGGIVMTKEALRINLEAGKMMDDLFHYSAGQQCTIYKATAFTTGDEVIYFYCCCGDCDLYGKDITGLGIHECEHFEDL